MNMVATAKIIAACERFLSRMRKLPEVPCTMHPYRDGERREFGGMAIVVCDSCAARLEHMAPCVPGEIEAETSRLVTAIQVRL